MANKNPECCGGHCQSSVGEVRVYPLGSGANLILCRACWTHENGYRAMRAVETGNHEAFPYISWAKAEVYKPSAQDGGYAQAVQSGLIVEDCCFCGSTKGLEPMATGYWCEKCRNAQAPEPMAGDIVGEHSGQLIRHTKA